MLEDKTLDIETNVNADKSARDIYKADLEFLQIELVKLQKHVIKTGEKILIILEGRDTAGKDGSIKRITEYLSPRETRVVALGKPSDREQSGWYFQRFVSHLPLAGDIVLFNRSWYNRAGVEQVLGFCTKAEYESFMLSVPMFEEMLVKSDVKLLKYYLDISKDEQISRIKDRQSNPLKQWKISPIDAVATKHWSAYSKARDLMLTQTHTSHAPWYIVSADHKREARLNLIRSILSQLNYAGKKRKLVAPDAQIVYPFTPDVSELKRLYP